MPRQFGYKSIKYVSRITVTDAMKIIGKGMESNHAEFGHTWYAGI